MMANELFATIVGEVLEIERQEAERTVDEVDSDLKGWRAVRERGISRRLLTVLSFGLVACSTPADRPTYPAEAVTTEPAVPSSDAAFATAPPPLDAGLTVVAPPADAAQQKLGCTNLPSRKTLETWPIQSRCSPGSGPVHPPERIVDTLPDGTQIVESLGRCFRVRWRGCRTKCMPGTAQIATPTGAVSISALEVGTEIWTQDRSGRRVAGSVLRISRVPVPSTHVVTSVTLADGRTVTASPEHPMTDGRALRLLEVADTYDGSQVVKTIQRTYGDVATFDVLPSGETGIYWADDVPLLSTLQ